MGLLRRATGDQECLLPGRMLVGRSPSCFLRIRDRRVSSEHARISFQRGSGWEVRDLGSRNGTTVNGAAVSPGAVAPLREGDVLCFGSTLERWQLADSSPPEPLAVARDGTIVCAERGFLAVPADRTPEVFVYPLDDGSWICEQGDHAEAIQDQAIVTAGGQPWTLHLSSSIDATWAPLGARSIRLSDVSLCFSVSPDEEDVTITLQTPHGASLLPSRAYNYMLLTLARARLADQQSQASIATEAGWVYADELCRMLRIDANKLGVDIHRARQLLGERGVLNAVGLIERRRTTRQLRIGLPRILVERRESV